MLIRDLVLGGGEVTPKIRPQRASIYAWRMGRMFSDISEKTSLSNLLVNSNVKSRTEIYKNIYKGLIQQFLESSRKSFI